MRPHVVFSVTEASQVGEVRRHAAGMAEQAGFDELNSGRLALVVTELGNNLVLHARKGRLLLARPEDDGPARVEVLSVDDGPGMANVAACMTDGFSTAGTPGTGLGAARRLSQAFDIFSALDQGTVVVAIVHAQAAPRGAAEPRGFEIAAVATAAPGETVSGDGWAWAMEGTRAAILVADGLGHGPQAAEASDAAIRVLAARANEAPQDIVQAIHAGLRGTRGAAVAVAVLDSSERSIAYCGAGNIVGRVVSGTSDRSMLSQHGTAGIQIRQPRDANYEWSEHGLVILHSDGVATRWDFSRNPGIVQHSAALIATWILRDFTRGRDDATVVVARTLDA